jgi:hypothetical protein
MICAIPALIDASSVTSMAIGRMLSAASSCNLSVRRAAPYTV